MNTLKQLLEACLSPLGIMTLLLAAGSIFMCLRRFSGLGRRLVLAGVALYLVFMFTPLAEICIAGLERPYPPVLRPDASAGIRAVVVLSGYGEDHPSLPATSKLSGETLGRLSEGIRLYRSLPGAKLIVSGGILRPEDPPVARLMAEYARDMGVADADILVEGRSLNTYENLVEIRKMLGDAPVLLVTSACDLWRALAVAHRLDMKPLAAPACIWAATHFPSGMTWAEWAWRLVERSARASADRLVYLQRAQHEYLGYFWYWMLGRV